MCADSSWSICIQMLVFTTLSLCCKSTTHVQGRISQVVHLNKHIAIKSMKWEEDLERRKLHLWENCQSNPARTEVSMPAKAEEINFPASLLIANKHGAGTAGCNLPKQLSACLRASSENTITKLRKIQDCRIITVNKIEKTIAWVKDIRGQDPATAAAWDRSHCQDAHSM